jgi:hypothetical protein
MMSSLLAQYKQNRPRYLDTDKEHPNHEYISKFYTFEFEKYKNKHQIFNIQHLTLIVKKSIIAFYLWQEKHE